MQTWLFVSEHYLWNGMKAHSFWGRNSLQNGGSHTHTDCGSISSRVCETPSKTRNMDNIRGRHNSHVHNREIPSPSESEIRNAGQNACCRDIGRRRCGHNNTDGIRSNDSEWWLHSGLGEYGQSQSLY